MSMASKIVLTSCCAASLGTIGYVHWKQNLDRMKLKEGLVRDQERQQVQHEMKKTMNTYNLQQQKELTKILKRGELASLANET